MQEETILTILKVLFIILFVSIVVVVGTLPLRSIKFKRNRFLKSMGTTFAGALFVNVAIIHILPESADSIEEYLKNGDPDAEVFPLANLLLMCGFLLTIFFTRIIATHEHSHDDDDSNASGSFGQPLGPNNPQQNLLENPQTIITDPDNENQAVGAEEPEEPLQEKAPDHQDSYFLTIAMYFHTIFEGIAIGVQNSIGGFLSTAIAIAFHKWADALSMGIHYRNRNVSNKIAYGLIIGQAALNALAIGFGWAIASFGDFTEAIFLSISAGTFLAISTMEMLGEQLHRPRYRVQKFAVLLVATGFISAIWFFENAIFSNSDDPKPDS